MRIATREPAGDRGTADRIEADEGHYWLRLVTRQAMDREGRSMGHCVGDGGYDEHAGSEEMADNAIWSLRRPDGVSVMTAQVRYLELDYAKGPKNSDPGRFESLQVAHLVAGFKEAGHAMKVDEDTGIVLLEDGRTFRVDRLPPDVVAARAEAARRLEEERAGPLASACNLVALRGQVFFRPAGSPSIRILGEGSPFEFVGGGSGGYPGGGGGGGAARVEESIERLEIRSNESPRRPIIDTLTLQRPLHFAMELTANEADPIVECWHEFDTGLETFRTRSGIRFSAGRRFSLMAAGSQDLIQAYRAAIARAEAERASAQPPADPVTFTAYAIQADDILNLQFPDGRSAYSVRDVEVSEGDVPVPPDRYALDAANGMLMVRDDHASLTVRFRAGEQPVPVTLAPGVQVLSQPITWVTGTPAPPAESYGRDSSRMRPSTLERVRRLPVGISLFGHEATYMGPWQRFQAYEPGAIVAHAGLPYVALVNVPAGELHPQEENASLWRLIDATFIEGCERVFAGGGNFQTLGDEHDKLRVGEWDRVFTNGPTALPWSLEPITSEIAPIAEPPS